MLVVRVYLLAGMVLHKVVWEVLKRRAPSPQPITGSFRLVVMKIVKLAILAGIVIQTALPEVLPIASDAGVIHILGTAIYTVGLLTAVLARIQLGSNWSDIEAAVIRPEHALVTRGVYRYIRHPIYAGDLALLLGLEMALNSWLVMGVVALAPFVLREAIREEQKLVTSLPGYDAYCNRTKRFLPFVV